MAELNKTYNIVGQPIPRVDAFDKVTGKALYAGDIVFPEMLHIKALRSARPHARILGIHTGKAEACPGVVGVFTHRNIPGTNRIGPRDKDQPLLCDDKVRHIGDPLAIVAAETLEEAEEAVSLIQVDLKDLPGIFSTEKALAQGAINIHESGNLLSERTLVKGCPEQAIKDADIVITNTYRTQMVEHAYLEPEAGVADFRDGKMTLWIPSKHAHFDQKEIGAILGLSPEKVRVVLTAIGGSFGDKQCISPGYYAALASFKTGRPCKMVYDREESFVASTKRHPCLIHYTTAASRDGRIIAVKVEIVADTGAYSSYGPSILVRAMAHAAGPYEIPNIYVKAKAVYTNNPTGGAMRGFGVPQIVMACESQMDILSQKLRLNPFEIRLRNALRPGSLTATGQSMGPSVGLSQTIKKVKRQILKMDIPQSSVSKRYGWGIACMYYGIGLTGLPNPGAGRIEANDSGDYTLFLGCGDVGQGSATIMAQIAAEVLRSKVERIKVISGDTDFCPDSGTSTASRVTYIVGRSVQIAAEKLRALLQESAASMIEIAKEDLVLENDFFYPFGSPHLKVSVGEVMRWMKSKGKPTFAEGRFNPETKGLDLETGQGIPYATYAFATQGALVSVDLESGEVEVMEMVACHDVGKALNPINLDGQIVGGISMGLGYGLTEEVILDDGVIRNPRFSQYLIPTSLDVPKIRTFLVENREPTGPFGSKGVGEPAIVPTVPAIINAIRNATGTHPREIPVTPENFWRLLKKV